MQIEQALFTSAQTERAHGYHLVARSSGIDDALAQKLALWCPSQNALVDRDTTADSLNFFCLDEDWYVLSRTVYAGAEYSDRGAFRLETNILMFRGCQLAGYDSHPLAVARVARALGLLRLRPTLFSELPPMEFPDALGHATIEPQPETGIDELVSDILNCDSGQRTVVVGLDSPADFVSRLLARLAPLERLQLSFSTGLKPSIHRPFALQFLPEVNSDLVRELRSRGMTCLEVPVPVS